MTLHTSDGSVIPSTYDELQKQYGKLIYKLLLKYNKVERNFEDLHGYVWLKILEAQLLERFEDHIQRQTPKVLTALQACDLLGVSWRQWSTAMWSYHKGDPDRYDKKGNILSRKRGRWMPTPINILEFQARGLAGYSAKTALFDFEDIIRLASDEKRFKNGKIRKAFRFMGRGILEGIVVSDDRPEGSAKLPEVSTTATQFRNYLAMAVLNHYANFCRTEKRKHKERPSSPPPSMEDDAPSWESTIPDRQATEMDAMVALSEAREMLSHTLLEHMDGVPSCKAVEDHAAMMFGMLDKGTSLVQALDSMGLPPKVKSAILDTVRPLASEYA